MVKFKYRPLFAAALVCFAGAGAGRAHSVHVFAFVDGDGIQVEAGFGGRRKVRNGKIAVIDAATAEVLLEGATDAAGRFRFRPPADFLATGHDLLIRLDAGEGHRGDWKIPAAELRALTPPADDSAIVAVAPTKHEPAAAENVSPSRPSAAPADFTVAEWEALLGRVVDAKLSPIKSALARQEERGPELRDVIGGFGWILGLLGLASYLKYGRRRNDA